jgi:hypothetical protein
MPIDTAPDEQRATRFLYALDRLTPAEWWRVLAQHEASWGTEWLGARRAMDRALAADGRLAALYDPAVVDRVRFRAASIGGASGVSLSKAEDPRALASYAALAVLTAASIDPRHREVLLAPFAGVVSLIEIECQVPLWTRADASSSREPLSRASRPLAFPRP